MKKQEQILSIMKDLESKAITTHQATELILVLFDINYSLPLGEIEKKIDLLLKNETDESLRKWVNDKRQ